MYRIAEGNVLAASAEFLDDENQPVIARPGYPKVWLKDGEIKLVSLTASPSSTPGQWSVDVPVPLLGLEDQRTLKLVWIHRDGEDNKIRLVEPVTVLPRVDMRMQEVLFIEGDEAFECVLPTATDPADLLTAQLYRNNQVMWTSRQDINASTVARGEAKTQFSMAPPPDIQPTLSAYLLRVDHRPVGASVRTYTFKFWCITPQLMLAMSHVEDFLNKSRIENVIPELRWTQSDLMGYLERGLNLFNTVGITTNFTGTNMQGPLFEAHLICAQYYALCAQLIAEGSLAFNFSGQGISLDVDRTPALESALGRIEGQMNDLVRPLKTQLSKQNLLGGDGSVGNTGLRNSRAFGTLGLINAATTRFPYYGGAFMGRRS